MRLGVVADVHGNDLALRAVLNDAGRVGVDRWWALGDLVLFGPRPVEVLELLLGLPGIEMLSGNTDRLVGGTRALNPGSAGLPRTSGSASWLLLEDQGDAEAVVADLRRRRHPNAEFVTSILIGSRPLSVVISHGTTAATADDRCGVHRFPCAPDPLVCSRSRSAGRLECRRGGGASRARYRPTAAGGAADGRDARARGRERWRRARRQCLGSAWPVAARQCLDLLHRDQSRTTRQGIRPRAASSRRGAGAPAWRQDHGPECVRCQHGGQEPV